MQSFLMKSTLLAGLLAFGLLHPVSAQNVTFNANHVTLKSAMAQVKKQTGYSFVFKNGAIANLKKVVNIHAKDAPVSQVVDQMLSGEDVSYEIQGKTIIVYRKDGAQQIKQTHEGNKGSRVKVSGKILDSNGDPIIGATIKQKGSSNGTVSDVNGYFSFEAPEGSTLDVTYIGYQPQSLRAIAGREITVSMKEDQESLNEVVVVGYGTQKKVDLSGSVAAIDVAKITESRPITNISNALTGMAAGVTVTSANNAPGNDDASILVRGQGTLNNSSPLIIIDGVEASMSSVNPQDVESISVLKDAAASSIYGSRAANGVILITTKKGKKGSLKLDYNGYLSLESARKTYKPVSDYVEYMKLMNEGYENSGLPAVFSQTSIDAWANNDDPILYPNNSWTDALFKTQVGTNHVLSMSGGSDKFRSYTSFGYMDNPGIMENSGEQKYSLRMNVEGDVRPWLTLGANFSGYFSDIDIGNENISTALSAIGPPDIVYRHDGKYGSVNNSEDDPQQVSCLMWLNNRKGSNEKHDGRIRLFGTFKPFKGLSVTASYNYEYKDWQIEQTPVQIDLWNFLSNTIVRSGKDKTWVSNRNTKEKRNYWDVIARYENKFIDNRLGVELMAGTSREQYMWKYYQATRYDLVDLSLDAIDAATGESTSSGYKTEWAMNSYFGRMNLNWMEKYLFEFNLRADGSSRFQKSNRWGYFPSASAAWRISEESFMKDAGFSNLKLRVSYGALGNNSVGNYDALSLFSQSNYVFNNNMAIGMAQKALANSNLTWEKTYVANLGIDFGILKNRLTGTIDIFNKKTKDILINLPAPLVHGVASIPKQNSATVRNRGLEFQLGWNDHIGEFNYSINGNFTYVKNKVLKFKGDDYSLSGANYIKEGLSINSQYLLRVDRIIQTDEDLQKVKDMQTANPNAFAAFGVPGKGDLLYKDLNGDGLINNEDKEICSDGPNPKFLFGLNLSASYKNFDLSVLCQGQAGVKVYWQQYMYFQPTVRWGCMINKEIADGRWYEGRTDAKYPRLLQYQDTRNTQYSDQYLQNKAYFKIRNIQIGYTLPNNISHAIYLERVRFYCSLENFFTFTSYKGLDPEVSGIAYPTIKQAVFGVNISF